MTNTKKGQKGQTSVNLHSFYVLGRSEYPFFTDFVLGDKHDTDLSVFARVDLGLKVFK